MPIPNSITRTVELPHPQAKVWAALTTIDGLTAWFGSHADGVVAPGEEVVMSWEQHGFQTKLSIKVVDPMNVFAYCWPIVGAPQGDPRRTYVEFRLEPRGSGTALTVTETGFAQLPEEWVTAYNGNTEGWAAELGELVAYLDAA